MEDKKQISAAEYFKQLKDVKNKNTDEELDKFYDAAIALLSKYRMFCQKKMIKKLMFIIDCIPKEKQLLDLGIDTFIYKDDIEEFINKVEGKAVKIIEIENYPRDIPEELAPIVQATQDIFDEFYVLFTDYNGKEERKIAKERKEKDPILLGVFKNLSIMNDRFYYLGDWVDEYCDLTLEKLISEAGNDIIKNIKVPENKKEIIKECNDLIENGNTKTYRIQSNGFTPINTTTVSSISASNVNVITLKESDNNGSKN